MVCGQPVPAAAQFGNDETTLEGDGPLLKVSRRNPAEQASGSGDHKMRNLAQTIQSVLSAIWNLIISGIEKADRFITAKLSGPAAFFRKLQSRGVLYTIYHSFLVYLIVEMLSRRSLIEGIVYMAREPAVFIYNWILVMATMSVALLFKKRGFAFLVISLVWVLLGLINCVLLGFRTTPLNFMDFRTFKDVMGIMNVYFSPVQLMAMLIGVTVFIIVMTFLLIKTPSEKIAYHKAGATVTVFCALLAGATFVSVGNGTLITTFHNIQDAYKDYGFAYCFAASVVDRGIARPDGYSEESIQAIVDEINEASGEEGTADIVPSEIATETAPNIIILQMESFFDPKTLKGVTYSEDPVPNFTSMMENYSSGWLTTPSFGAGTANTEYEVNTGMSVAYFGPGEYPYTTIMRKTTSESVANNLKDYGYGTHAIHNHTGKFYGRYLVYPNLGFDSFTSVEYMQNVERNPLDWASDSILTGEIQKAVASTEGPDYVFAVSVQGHGKYPTVPIDDTQTITVSGYLEEETVGFEYFVNQVHRMDAFLGELTTALTESGEPSVLVVYGDHLPKFSITNNDVVNGNIYQTQYVVWDNFGLQKQDEDVTTYQLSAHVMDLLGMHNGIMTKLQQNCTQDDNYFSKMAALQYDMLYGSDYAYEGKKFERTDMEMGIDPIIMTDISCVGDRLYVKGENFTAASKIYLNGEQVPTSYLNSGRISCRRGHEISDGDTIEVIQMSSRRTRLSSAGVWEWQGDGPLQISEPNRNISLDSTESKEVIQDDIDKEENEI